VPRLHGAKLAPAEAGAVLPEKGAFQTGKNIEISLEKELDCAANSQ